MIQAILSQLFSFSCCLNNCSDYIVCSSLVQVNIAGWRRDNWSKNKKKCIENVTEQSTHCCCISDWTPRLLPARPPLAASLCQCLKQSFQRLPPRRLCTCGKNEEIKNRKWPVCRWMNEAKELTRMNLSLTSSSPPMHCWIFCRRTRASMPSWTAGLPSQSNTSGLRPCVPEAEFGSVWVCSRTRGRSSQLRWQGC